MFEDFVTHLLGEWAKAGNLLFPLRSLYLRAFVVRISGLKQRAKTRVRPGGVLQVFIVQGGGRHHDGCLDFQ